MGSEAAYPAVVEDKHSVSVLNGGNTLGNDDLCCSRDPLSKGFTNFCIGRSIDRTCRVVEDKHLRVFEERSCDTKTLLLTARNVASSLLDIGIVSIGEAFDEFICAGKLADRAAFFLGSIFIAPAEVVKDSSREKNVLLENYRNAVSESFEIVGLNVLAADINAAVGYIVKTADEVYKARFAAARSADDADSFALMWRSISSRTFSPLLCA